MIVFDAMSTEELIVAAKFGDELSRALGRALEREHAIADVGIGLMNEARAIVDRVRVACAAHDSWNACVCDACVAVGANPAAIEYGVTK